MGGGRAVPVRRLQRLRRGSSAPWLARRIAQIVDAHDIEPSRFVLEITESAWSLEASRLAAGARRAAGRRLRAGDRRLRSRLLVAVAPARAAGAIIKVDRAFLHGVPHDPQANGGYSAIMRLADACGCDVMAEGVEDAAQAPFLGANGCRIAQGFHFSRPVPGPEVTALLSASVATDRRRQRRRTAAG